MKTHHPDIPEIKKIRLDKNGGFIDGGLDRPFKLKGKNAEVKYKAVKRAFSNSYGCRLIGNFTVKEVPGNFHISAHVFRNFYEKLIK